MKGALVFTTHALRRMLKHGIRSGQMREVLEKGERIESYPDDTPLPSYLMLGTGEGRVLHVVAADDEAQDETIVITSYEPIRTNGSPIAGRGRSADAVRGL